MWLTLQNLYTTISKATPEELGWMWKFLSYEDPQKERVTGSGTVRLISERHKRFQTGLVPLVEKHAKAAGFDVQRIDKRDRPHPLPWDQHAAQADLDWLKTRQIDGEPYQYDAVKCALRSGRGIVRVPTGGGKGEIVVGLCKAIPCRWLFLVHRSHLAEDIQNRWEKRGDGTGHVWLGKDGWEPGERVSFCTFQTLYRALRNPKCKNALSKIEGVIVDECHVLPAGSFSEVSEALINAYYRIGLSGTPLERSDGRGLLAIAQTGPVLYNVTPKSLMDAGYVASATVHITDVKQQMPKGLRRSWATVRKHAIAQSKVRNAAVLRDVMRCPKPAMVFVDLLSHGRILRDAIRSAGFSVEFAWGKTDKQYRKRLVERCKNGSLEVLVANGVFREGVDIPNLESVVYASGMKSPIQVIQGAGRGSRVTDDKKTFHIYDYRDSGAPYIGAHSAERIRIYSRYGYSVVENVTDITKTKKK